MQWEPSAMPGTLVSDRFMAAASLFVPSGRKPLEEKQGLKITWADCYPPHNCKLHSLFS